MAKWWRGAANAVQTNLWPAAKRTLMQSASQIFKMVRKYMSLAVCKIWNEAGNIWNEAGNIWNEAGNIW